MIYLVTGASGFIGKRLVRRLLAHPSATVYFLIRDPAPERIEKLCHFWHTSQKRAIPLKGDISKAYLGLSAKDRKALNGRVDHVFHLAAIYDLNADPAEEMAVNIEGTRNTVELAEAIDSKRFHHISSIAAAGLCQGVFREDMFEEAIELSHPYFASKHESEKVVRTECKIPWRVYRPGMVVGDSQTGEMDKIDGPYYFFRLIKRIRDILPAWMPMIGIEGGRINLVPVDFVAAALDCIAHTEGQDGKCFHLTDTHPRRVGDVLNIFAHAGHAPDISMRVNLRLLRMMPTAVVQGIAELPAAKRIRAAVMKDLGLPEGIFAFVNYPTRFDNTNAASILEPAGITIPPLESYAAKLWDYWERNLDPDLLTDRSLRARISGQVVLITGGSSGIGKALAFKLAAAGAKVLIAARDQEKLKTAGDEASQKGFVLQTYAADVTDRGQCEQLVKTVLREHGRVDILVNNAGRSIRRGVHQSIDRLHDFERTMQVNYFGPVQLTLALLPSMSEKQRGHIVNISSIGVLTSPPRFSAYVASKAALEAWTRCAASEYFDRGIHFSVVNLPLVRTPMIAPTKLYDHAPALSPEQAADMIAGAIISRSTRTATRLGVFGQIVQAILPRLGLIVNNTLYQVFPESAGQKDGAAAADHQLTPEQIVFTHLFPGIHV
jgi:NAD(P)-dependent dehydrogenase (short-subunit alcohol dehydrogenase family)